MNRSNQHIHRKHTCQSNRLMFLIVRMIIMTIRTKLPNIQGDIQQDMAAMVQRKALRVITATPRHSTNVIRLVWQKNAWLALSV